METIMMQLGPFQFGLATAAYQELTRSTEWRWPSQDRFGRDAALQFTGPGTDSITVNGVIFPEYRGGTFQIDDMRVVASLGEPLLLMDGRGGVMGLWVIEKVDEKGTIFADQGVARRQDFTMQLKRFGDLESLLQEAAGGSDTFASVVAEVGAVVGGGLPSLPSLPGGLGGLGGLAGGLAGMAGAAQSAAAGALASLTGAQGMLGSLGGIIPGGIGQLSGALNGAISSAKSMALGGVSLGSLAKLGGSSLGSIAGLAGASSAVSGLMSQASALARDGGSLGALASKVQGSIPGLSGGSLASMLAVRASGGKAATKAMAVYQQGSNLMKNFGL